MFGYIRAFKPDLKVFEDEQYRAVYCSLCRELGSRYGKLAQMTLSYDFTFLAMLGMAKAHFATALNRARCRVNPFRKVKFVPSNSVIQYTCDAAVILTYHKIIDNIEDDGFFKSIPARFLKLFLRRKYTRAQKFVPKIHRLITDCMEEQRAEEKREFSSLDQSAHASAKMLEGIAKHLASDDREEQVLARFGYCLGRWIYFVDAFDDFEEDKRKGKYNPFVCWEKTADGGDVADYASQVLFACIYECEIAYNLLEINTFDNIVRNILQLGMPVVQQSIVKKMEENDGKHRSI